MNDKKFEYITSETLLLYPKPSYISPPYAFKVLFQENIASELFEKRKNLGILISAINNTLSEDIKIHEKIRDLSKEYLDSFFTFVIIAENNRKLFITNIILNFGWTWTKRILTGNDILNTLIANSHQQNDVISSIESTCVRYEVIMMSILYVYSVYNITLLNIYLNSQTNPINVQSLVKIMGNILSAIKVAKLNWYMQVISWTTLFKYESFIEIKEESCLFHINLLYCLLFSTIIKYELLTDVKTGYSGSKIITLAYLLKQSATIVINTLESPIKLGLYACHFKKTNTTISKYKNLLGYATSLLFITCNGNNIFSIESNYTLVQEAKKAMLYCDVIDINFNKIFEKYKNIMENYRSLSVTPPNVDIKILIKQIESLIDSKYISNLNKSNIFPILASDKRMMTALQPILNIDLKLKTQK